MNINYPVFISYSRQDLNIAKRIKSEIEDNLGVQCWMDLDGIESGAQFQDIIIRAIDHSHIVLFLLSKHSMESEWTKKELNYASAIKKRIVPVNIDRSEPKGWFLFNFAGIDVIDYSDSRQREKLFLNLNSWAQNKVGDCQVFKNTEKVTLKFDNSRFYRLCAYLHAIVFGLLLLKSLCLFFFGLHETAKWANLLLFISLTGTLAMTYLLVFSHRRIALPFMCLLSFIEIFLICTIAQNVWGYKFHALPMMRSSFIDTNLHGLGAYIHNHGFWPIALLMESLALFHVGLINFITFMKIKGRNLWEQLS